MISRLINSLKEWMIFLGEEMDEERVVIRNYQDTDAAFVFSTWRNSVWFDKKERLDAAAASFFKETSKKIKRLIKQPKANLRIACLSTDRDHIIGCALKIGSCLEWIYVKKDYRGQGIGNLLAGEFSEISRPVTEIGLAIQKKKNFKIKGEKNNEEKSGDTNAINGTARTDAEAA
jgi:GNAT superfamily N-acetyltransferase